ncbi:MAG TPA: DUF2142 domain-containing protein [Thermoanaerobaculia bacterium]
MTREWTPKAFFVVAVLLGLAWVFVTPAFTVPDERGHFLRGVAIAGGDLRTAPRPEAMVIEIDQGLRDFSWRVLSDVDRAWLFDARFRSDAARIRFDGRTATTWVVPLYTPLPYIPQALVGAAGSLARMRPVIVFYAGRIANLVAWMGIIALAIRIAPSCAQLFAVIALLPMSLFLFGSWSADAASIALAMLFTALVVREASAVDSIPRSHVFGLAAAAFLLALGKPAYALLTAVVVAIPRSRFASRSRYVAMVALVGGAAVIGTLISMEYFNRAYYNFRPQLPIDPAAQASCIRHDPARFADVVARDVRQNVRFYIDQIAGRFAHNEIKLQDWVWRTEWIALAIIAATTIARVRPVFRAAALVIALTSIIAIITSQYVIWSIVCSDTIQGVQGRYFLPVLPLLGLAVGGFWKWRPPAVLLLIVAIVCNASALATVIVWYA